MNETATEPSVRTGANDTPIMKQYHAAKARYPRHLLFFRVGDFFELFHDDAKTISRVLGLTLTARNKGPDPIPMAGVPAHTCEQYLARLLRQGYSVAICDQTEDASQAKGLVKRDITRVVTPGTVLEENLLDARKPNRLVAITAGTGGRGPGTGKGKESGAGSREPGAENGARFGIAAVDLASGSFFVQELVGETALRSEFARLAPSECLLPEESNVIPIKGETAAGIPTLPSDGVAFSKISPAAFAPGEAHDRIVSRFSDNGRDKQAATRFRKMAKEMPLAFSAAGALLGYIEETHAGGKTLLLPPQPFDPDKHMLLGESAIRSLELVETLRGRSFDGSLLWSIDRCCGGPGSRCLREWILRPLRDLEAIRARQDAIAQLVEAVEPRSDLRGVLKQVADLERVAARLAANRAGPRDLLCLKESLQLFPKLHSQIEHCLGGSGMLAPPPPAADAPAEGGLLAGIRDHLQGLDNIAAIIAARLMDECPNAIGEGGLIKEGVDAELDRLRAIASGGKGWIASFEAGECKRTGINSLKVGYNRVFGYYIEISHANKAHVPKDYERRQTLTNAERYTTPEMKEREAEVLGAEEKIRALEQKLFLALRDEVAASAADLHSTGRALAELDALCSLAEIAHRRGHVRPTLNNSGRLYIEQMRHPVLEETLPRGDLVPNDLGLEAPNGKAEKPGGDRRIPQILLLTGPNMAGKSTYIRASALCVILAQIGAFVPAESAEIGIVDCVFTRVGAADDLAGGRSTFMVEMTEVAEILTSCTSRSLLILDEVGRGTSTYDGVSLAWALVEHLHNGAAKPRTLFATHYHELCGIEEELSRVGNASASVKEWQGEITFLHRIVPGCSERSFGIHAARLAGLPAELLTRAREILQTLENEAASRVLNLTEGGAQVGSGGSRPVSGRRKPRRKEEDETSGQLHLFESRSDEADPALIALRDRLKAVDPNGLTPLQALTLLDELVRRAKDIR